MNLNLKITRALLSFMLFASFASGQKFTVSYTKGVSETSFSGKVFLYLSKENKNPKDGAIGFEPLACFSTTVKNIKPLQKIEFNDSALSYPVSLSDIERGEYYVQAVWDLNKGGRAIGNSAGNIFSESQKFTLNKNKEQVFNLECNQVIPEQSFSETKFVKELVVNSPLLSAFYKRPTTLNAAVLLPKEYALHPERKFPVLIDVSGFGGDYHGLSGRDGVTGEPMDTTACISLILDGNCSLGHSVYANSDNNGPWGDALTQELIPELEKKFRCNGARFLTGHSSGGWTVLWLQTQYPDFFAGCWSSSPDPVDFRSFQKADLYKDKNIFYTKEGEQRLVATVAGYFPWASMKTIYSAENVIWRGEQMHSFDAVFSTKNADGTPRRLCNAISGEIDPVTVEHWKKYDISLNLRTNWDKLKNSLEGKIRISVGNQDNFLLNYAVYMMEKEMKKLNAKFIFAYFPGDHFTVSTPEYADSGNKFLQQKYVEFLAQQKLKGK
ncbi:MAG: hypothetical protein IAF38_23005 [Bacteroidia bacterium]|nr:hypothetical protein [Bacteroidia bacterium]